MAYVVVILLRSSWRAFFHVCLLIPTSAFLFGFSPSSFLLFILFCYSIRSRQPMLLPLAKQPPSRLIYRSGWVCRIVVVDGRRGVRTDVWTPIFTSFDIRVETSEIQFMRSIIATTMAIINASLRCVTLTQHPTDRKCQLFRGHNRNRSFNYVTVADLRI
ncbi:hypothetical protein C8Q75DRAFT_401938 [Abortiporus biennis]|nr:hypothetical protein C8Q75DRAFT_401938 [Abortiporus biennis]